MIIVWGSEVLLFWGQIQGAESTRGCTPHPFPITLWIDRVKTQIQSHSSPPCAVPSLHSRPTLWTLWTYSHHAPLSMDSPGKNTEWGTCLAIQWLRCLAFTAGHMGLIHGWGTRLPHTMPYDQKKEYWSGLPCPSPGDLPNPGSEPASFVSCMGRQFFTLVPLGKPVWDNTMSNHSVLLFNTIKGITMWAQTAWTLLVQVIKTPMLGEMNDVLSSPISQLNINLLLTLA